LMKTPRPTTLGEQAAKALRLDGCTLTDTDVLALFSLADRATNGAQDDRLLFFPARRLGGMEVNPLSLAAKIWLNTQVAEWFGMDTDAMAAARIFAHHHSRRPSVFDFESPQECREAIIAWAKGIKATTTEVADAIAEVNDLEPAEGADTAPRCLNCKHLVSTGKCGGPEALARMGSEDVHPDFACRFHVYKVTPKQRSISPTMALLHVYFPGHDDDYWLAKPDYVLGQMIARAVDLEAGRMGAKGENFDRQDPCILAAIALTELKAAIRQRDKAEAPYAG